MRRWPRASSWASYAGNLPLFNPVSHEYRRPRRLPVRCWARKTPPTASATNVDSVLVPQLPPGITIVELTVHTERGDDVRVAEFVEITNIVTRPTGEVFVDLIDAESVAGGLALTTTPLATWSLYDPAAVADQRPHPGLHWRYRLGGAHGERRPSRAGLCSEAGSSSPWSRDRLTPIGTAAASFPLKREPGAAAPHQVKEQRGAVPVFPGMTGRP